MCGADSRGTAQFSVADAVAVHMLTGQIRIHFPGRPLLLGSQRHDR